MSSVDWTKRLDQKLNQKYKVKNVELQVQSENITLQK